MACGVIAYGGVAIGIVAVGGVAVGIVALGGTAIGRYALGDVALGTRMVSAASQDPVAVAFFQKWQPYLKWVFPQLAAVLAKFGGAAGGGLPGAN
ncbi:MAG: hypothetical protein O2820_02645 [Planctomycetota bacterium]|nr:hypothetical protein [Planctomycetota bacterium]MDA1248100.1 hypothetical protein [Planctomycetota bacterium]